MTIAALLLGLLPGLLKDIPGISAAIKQIIADVAGSAAAVLTSGVMSGPSVNTILAAWLGVISTLKNDPALPADRLALFGQLEVILQSVLQQDSKLAAGVDWTAFHPITPVA